MKATVVVGASLGGLPARTNVEPDFLPPVRSELHGYDEFIATVDALVIGGGAFEAVLAFDDRHARRVPLGPRCCACRVSQVK